MGNHSFRSGVVLILLFATLALAVPYVSRSVDGWLFSDDQPTKPRWNNRGPAASDSPTPLRPANPTLVPLTSSKGPNIAVSQRAVSEDDDAEPAQLAFDYQRPSDGTGLRKASEAQLTEFLQPVPQSRSETRPERHAPDSRDLSALEGELKNLGAAYLIVEQATSRGLFECRALFPIELESSYQKAFSANGTTPEQAMELVLAEAKSWKRGAARRSNLR